MIFFFPASLSQKITGDVFTTAEYNKNWEVQKVDECAVFCRHKNTNIECIIYNGDCSLGRWCYINWKVIEAYFKLQPECKRFWNFEILGLVSDFSYYFSLQDVLILQMFVPRIFSTIKAIQICWSLDNKYDNVLLPILFLGQISRIPEKVFVVYWKVSEKFMAG